MQEAALDSGYDEADFVHVSSQHDAAGRLSAGGWPARYDAAQGVYTDLRGVRRCQFPYHLGDSTLDAGRPVDSHEPPQQLRDLAFVHTLSLSDAPSGRP